MKFKFSYLLLIAVVFAVFSCKKSTPSSVPTVTFSTAILEGTANSSGEFELKGHISSATRLESVSLTKEGVANPFLVDNSTAKNKTEYDFSYTVTGISSNTYIIISITDQNGGNKTERYLVKK